MKHGAFLIPTGYMELLKQLPYPDALIELEEASFALLKRTLPSEVNIFSKFFKLLCNLASARAYVPKHYPYPRAGSCTNSGHRLFFLQTSRTAQGVVPQDSLGYACVNTPALWYPLRDARAPPCPLQGFFQVMVLLEFSLEGPLTPCFAAQHRVQQGVLGLSIPYCTGGILCASLVDCPNLAGHFCPEKHEALYDYQ